MAKKHKWFVSYAGDGQLIYSYSGNGAEFTAPNPASVEVDAIVDFLDRNGIDMEEIVRSALRAWIEARKRALAAGGEHAIEARKLRELAKALRQGNITHEVAAIIEKLQLKS